MTYIYLITNKVNGKVYVGKTTTSIELRWRGHCGPAKINTMPICRAIKKYGPENFEIKELDRTESELQGNWFESFYIGVLDSRNPVNGYNLSGGGDGTSGYKFTEQQLKNLSDAHKGKFRGEDSPHYGRKRPLETRLKMRAAKLGKPWSKAMREARGVGKSLTEIKSESAERSRLWRFKQVFGQELELRITFN